MVFIHNKYTTFNTCLECKEEIFNPICPLCLANSIKEWLKIKEEEFSNNIRNKSINNKINRNFNNKRNEDINNKKIDNNKEIKTQEINNKRNRSINNGKTINKKSKDAIKLKLLENYINDLMKNNEKFASNSILCIKCKSKSVYLCPYCFTEIILNKLKQIKASKKLKQEFFELFNFDFEHNGYSREFEEEI